MLGCDRARPAEAAGRQQHTAWVREGQHGRLTIPAGRGMGRGARAPPWSAADERDTRDERATRLTRDENREPRLSLALALELPSSSSSPVSQPKPNQDMASTKTSGALPAQRCSSLVFLICYSRFALLFMTRAAEANLYRRVNAMNRIMPGILTIQAGRTKVKVGVVLTSSSQRTTTGMPDRENTPTFSTAARRTPTHQP